MRPDILEISAVEIHLPDDKEQQIFNGEQLFTMEKIIRADLWAAILTCFLAVGLAVDPFVGVEYFEAAGGMTQ